MFLKRALLVCSLLCFCVFSSFAQERTATQQSGATNEQQNSEDVVRITTRVVLIDTLVRDKKTGQPVRDLSQTDFQVMDNGKPRQLSYFSREGLSRRRLALVLDLDLCTSAILYLEKPEVMEHIISALSKLQPEDEVAVMQTWYEPLAEHLSFEVRSKMVDGMTRDRAKTVAALRSVQQFAKENLPKVKLFFSLKETYKATWKDSIFAGIKTAGGGVPEPPFKIAVAPDYENVIDKAPQLATKERPDSQVMLIEVTDDFGAEGYGKTTQTANKLIGANVTVNGLVMVKDLMGKAIEVTGRILAPLTGQRFHTVSYYSQQTGGEVATVGNAEEFSAAVDRIIGGVAARYSLGFTLGEGERDGGRMHKLEVKVKARDAQGKERKVSVNARRGYYLPKAAALPASK